MRKKLLKWIQLLPKKTSNRGRNCGNKSPHVLQNIEKKEAMVKITIAGKDVVKQQSLYKTNVPNKEIDTKACYKSRLGKPKKDLDEEKNPNEVKIACTSDEEDRFTD